MNRFFIDLTERVVGTFAQSWVGILGADHVLGLVDVDWAQGLSVAGLAAVLSLAKGLAARYRGDDESASLSKNV